MHDENAYNHIVNIERTKTLWEKLESFYAKKIGVNKLFMF